MALEVWWARPTARTTMPSECSKQLQSGLPVSTLWTHCICDALHEKHCSYLGLAPGGSAGGVLVAPRHAPAMWGQLLRCHAPPPPPWRTPPPAARRLQALGLATRTKDAAATGGTFPYVLFSAPPSGSADYVAEIKAALALWDGTGAFVFTSSGGVYTVEDGSGGAGGAAGGVGRKGGWVWGRLLLRQAAAGTANGHAPDRGGHPRAWPSRRRECRLAGMGRHHAPLLAALLARHPSKQCINGAPAFGRHLSSPTVPRARPRLQPATRAPPPPS